MPAVAVPVPVSEYLTVTTCVFGSLSVTANASVDVAPESISTAVGEVIAINGSAPDGSLGMSSSTIVPIPVEVWMTALVGSRSVT